MFISGAMIIVQVTFNNTVAQGGKPLFKRHGAQNILKCPLSKQWPKTAGFKLIQDLYQS